MTNPPPRDSAQLPPLPDLTSGVVNDACWKFIEAMPHELPGPIFNDLKPALFEALTFYAREALRAQAASVEPVAYGYPNSGISTGSGPRFMMLRNEVPKDDQYGGALWVPLYTAPPPSGPTPTAALPNGLREAAMKIESITHYNAGLDEPYLDIDGADLWMSATDFSQDSRWKIGFLVDAAKFIMTLARTAPPAHIPAAAQLSALLTERLQGLSAVSRAQLGQEIARLFDAPQPQAVAEGAGDAVECLQDVVSHHRDFVKACTDMSVRARHRYNEDDASYWAKQVEVLDRMKGQAIAALATKEQRS